MRIAVISTPVFPCPPVGYSGLEMIAYQQAKGLGERGHEVLLIAPDGSQCPGVQVYHTGPPGQHHEQHAYGGHKFGRDYPGYWQILNQCEVILDHTWQKLTIIAKQEGWLKAPVLAWCHAPVDTMFKQLPPPGLLSFVCISEDQGNHFRNLFGRDCRVCYNGVDLDFYKPLGTPRTDRFLFLARFSSIKCPDLAIEACKKAGVGLDLIGDTQLTGEPEYLKSILHMADGILVQPGTRPRPPRSAVPRAVRPSPCGGDGLRNARHSMG